MKYVRIHVGSRLYLTENNEVGEINNAMLSDDILRQIPTMSGRVCSDCVLEAVQLLRNSHYRMDAHTVWVSKETAAELLMLGVLEEAGDPKEFDYGFMWYYV